jgi:serine/threonine-protein kinase
LLAQGGRSFVYKAVDTTTDEIVTLQAFVARLDDKQQARVGEVRETLVRLQHPNLVRLRGVGVLQGRLWLATEFMRGNSLEKELATRGALPMLEVAAIASQIARAVGAGHAVKLLHRSLKPSNVLLLDPDATGRRSVKLLDTGLWTILYGGTGGTLATPQMMAPEECGGGIVDVRSDVYSLGVLVFQLLTGRVPFDAPTLNELKDAHLRKDPPHVRALKPAAEPMEAVVNRALLKRAADRFPSMAEFARALDEILAAPCSAMILDGSEPQPPSPPHGGTWQVVGAEAIRTLVEPEKRPLLVPLPPEARPREQAPSRKTPSGTRTNSQGPAAPTRNGRTTIAWIVAAVVVVAWAIVGIIAWTR